MGTFINIYYNLLAIQNNIIINFLLFCNLFFPKIIKNKLIYYKNKSDIYYKYILLISLNDEINEKYNIDLLSIGLNIYSKYQQFTKKINEIDNISDISDISDISNISDISDINDINNINDISDINDINDIYDNYGAIR